jgi:hypothetical protein
MARFIELNPDQRREVVNTAQRFAAWRDASTKLRGYRGSMTWATVKGRPYLVRSAYTAKGERRQTSLGPQGPDTERLKADFDAGRLAAERRLSTLKETLARQVAMNRALGLGRVPMLGARIIRALDEAGLLGVGIRVLGTYALFAYEASAGVFIDPDLTTTEDIDLLFDARGGVSLAVSEELEDGSLLALLRRVDRSFERARQTFRAVNDEGFLVDLIRPMRDPPWRKDASGERGRIGGEDDIDAAEIEGLAWQESAPAFEAVCIDERGGPLRVVTSDPRVWGAHKLWLSGRSDRDPLKRRRDGEQGRDVLGLCRSHFAHLPFEAPDLRMLPRPVFYAAKAVFDEDAAGVRSRP